MGVFGNFADRLRAGISRTFILSGGAVPAPKELWELAQEGYHRNPIIYACVREIALSAAEAPVVVRMGQEEDAGLAPETDGLVELLRRPNDRQSAFEFMAEYHTHDQVFGNVMIEKVRDGDAENDTARIKGLRFLRPDRVKIKGNKDGTVKHYEHRLSDDVKPTIIRPHNLIHAKDTSLTDDWYGLSPVAVAAEDLSLENEIPGFLRRQFRAGHAPGFLRAKGAGVDLDDLVNQWNAKIKAAHQKGRLAVPALQGDVDFVSLASDPASLALDIVWSETETRICMVLGVPPVVIQARSGLTFGSSYRNYPEARRSLWMETLAPKYRTIGAVLTRGLGDEYGGVTRVVSFDLSRVEALERDRTRDRLLATRSFKETDGMTLREYREAMSGVAGTRMPVEDHPFYTDEMLDLPYTGLVKAIKDELGIVDPVPVIAPRDGDADGEGDGEGDDGEGADGSDGGSESGRKARGENLALADDGSTPFTRAILAVADDHTDAMAEAFAAAVETSTEALDTADFEAAVEDESEDEAVEALAAYIEDYVAALDDDETGFRPVFVDTLEAAYEVTEDELGVEEAEEQQATVAQLETAARGLTRTLQSYLRSTASASIAEFTRNVIVNGVPAFEAVNDLKLGLIALDPHGVKAVRRYRAKLANEGKSQAEIDKLSRLQFEGLVRQRAMLIAQTEAVRASNTAVRMAAKDAAKKADATAYKLWLTVGDGRVCPICLPLHEQEVEIDAPFSGGHDQPPAHPRCRCGMSVRVQES